jgi:catalase
MPIEGDAAHWDHRVDDDHWSSLATPERQQLLFDNTARGIGGAASHIQARHIENCTRADPAYGAGVAKALTRLADRI